MELGLDFLRKVKTLYLKTIIRWFFEKTSYHYKQETKSKNKEDERQ